MPPRRKTDDEAAHGTAKALWTDLREDVSVVAERRIAALERALEGGRTWDVETFQTCWVNHPLMTHLARRLVWSSAGKTFRVAEDQTLADVDEEPFTLEPGGRVRLPSRDDWPDDTFERWQSLFEDYDLLQPVLQLGEARHSKPP